MSMITMGLGDTSICKLYDTTVLIDYEEIEVEIEEEEIVVTIEEEEICI